MTSSLVQSTPVGVDLVLLVDRDISWSTSFPELAVRAVFFMGTCLSAGIHYNQSCLITVVPDGA